MEVDQEDIQFSKLEHQKFSHILGSKFATNLLLFIIIIIIIIILLKLHSVNPKPEQGVLKRRHRP